MGNRVPKNTALDEIRGSTLRYPLGAHKVRTPRVVPESDGVGLGSPGSLAVRAQQGARAARDDFRGNVPSHGKHDKHICTIGRLLV